MSCITPVSYTHLDVYKRQAIVFPLFILEQNTFQVPIMILAYSFTLTNRVYLS